MVSFFFLFFSPPFFFLHFCNRKYIDNWHLMPIRNHDSYSRVNLITVSQVQTMNYNDDRINETRSTFFRKEEKLIEIVHRLTDSVSIVFAACIQWVCVAAYLLLVKARLIYYTKWTCVCICVYVCLFSGTYWLFVGISTLGFIFFGLLLPETKGKKLEDVDQLFAKPWCSCCSSERRSSTVHSSI